MAPRRRHTKLPAMSRDARNRTPRGVSLADPARPGFVDAMLEPGFYPRRPRSVELRETHISWVFRAGLLAYKVKKPLKLPYLDYGSPERRLAMCREEVRLNRRLAPQIYLRVVGIARCGRRYAIVPEHDPEAFEYAVEMRAVEEERSLAALAERDALTGVQVEEVGARIARFHDWGAPVPPERRDPRRTVAAIEHNLATLREAAAETLDVDRLRAAEDFTAAFLAARMGQLEERAESGRMRDGHGDLRAEHVILPTRAPLYVYDCIEFDRGLREIDVAADLAFLVMDLHRLAGEEPVESLIRAYRRAGGDPGDDSLLSFLASYRAWVRATVACERALELGAHDPERAQRESEAKALLALGHRFAWRARRPLLLVVCGVAASGKTTLAERLAQASGWEHVSSDLVRKGLAGIPPAQRGGEELYSPERTARTYRQLGRAAADRLARNGGTIVDATFNRAEERHWFDEGLGDASPRRLFVECHASPEVLLRRARERQLDAHRVSDAGPKIVERQLAERDPFPGRDDPSHVRLSTEGDPERLVAEVERSADRLCWAGPTTALLI